MLGLKAAKNFQKCVQVEWEDGLMAKFSYIWLRDNTRRRPFLVHLDLNTRPEALKCSRDALEVQWHPFLASKYTSTFLRENALHHPIDSKNTPSSSSNGGLLTEEVERMWRARKSDQLGGQLYAIVDARLPIDESLVLGTCYWEEVAQEPATIWPHLPKIPSLVSVDSLNGLGGSAELSLVDTRKSLMDLCEQHPEEFDFLAQCVLEYGEGPYRSMHPICKVDDDGEIVPGVFNNAARSSAITVDSLDRLYESLQKFGRICAENTHSLRLHAGQRLLFNNTAGMLGAPAQAGRVLALKCFS